MSQEKEVEKPYSFGFDRHSDTWVCSIHGPVSMTARIPCWNGCDNGFFDAYEDDPINNDPGDIKTCRECRGKGCHVVCLECNINNPDAEV